MLIAPKIMQRFMEQTMNKRPLCPKCDGDMELVRYSRGDPEALSAGLKGERPKLHYECMDEECKGYSVLREHLGDG